MVSKGEVVGKGARDLCLEYIEDQRGRHELSLDSASTSAVLPENRAAQFCEFQHPVFEKPAMLVFHCASVLKNACAAVNVHDWRSSAQLCCRENKSSAKKCNGSCQQLLRLQLRQARWTRPNTSSRSLGRIRGSSLTRSGQESGWCGCFFCSREKDAVQLGALFCVSHTARIRMAFLQRRRAWLNEKPSGRIFRRNSNHLTRNGRPEPEDLASSRARLRQSLVHTL